MGDISASSTPPSSQTTAQNLKKGSEERISSKKRLMTLLLCVFLGWIGAHRFYTGKVGTAIVCVMTFGGLLVWPVIDMFFILIGKFKDIDGRVVKNW